MDYYEIGQRIRRVRRARGFSQEQAAEQTGISAVHMSHIESGNTKLSLPVFVRLTEVLQVSADELLQGEPSAQRARAEGAILSLLDSCSLTQLQILQDVLCSVKQALDVRLEK